MQHSTRSVNPLPSLACLLPAVLSLTVLVGCSGSKEAGTTDASQRIAFQTNRDGNSEIYLMDQDGTNLINLTNRDSRHGVR